MVPNFRTIEYFLYPHFYPITKDLFTAVPSTQYIRPSYQEKNYNMCQKAKTQFVETEQVSKPNMAGNSKLSGQKFKTTVINVMDI